MSDLGAKPENIFDPFKVQSEASSVRLWRIDV
jgi:hypothetical protein